MAEHFYKEKFNTFLLGLLFGLLIGGGFFFLKLNDYFSDFKSIKMLMHSRKDTVVTIIPAQNNNLLVEKKQKNIFPATQKTTPKKIADSTVQKNNFSNDNSDPIKTDSLPNTTNKAENTDDIVVKTDQLITSKTVLVKILDAPLSKTQIKADSLLAKVSDTKNEDVALSYFRVEYWSSPLNYKGYKMSKNKILLYGIDSSTDVKLFQKDGFIYLKTPIFTYKLAYTDDFRQYEKVTDKDFLAQLK
ncbi:MAG: hypothetical protein ABI199_03970 [Bacteroidia bacterium]